MTKANVYFNQQVLNGAFRGGREEERKLGISNNKEDSIRDGKKNLLSSSLNRETTCLNIENKNYYASESLFWDGEEFSVFHHEKTALELIYIHEQTDISPSVIMNGRREKYQYRKIKVSSATIKNLEIAAQTIKIVRAGMPYGAGNQVVDLFASSGESDLRTIYARTHSEASTPFSPLIAGSSNCGGIAQVTAALLVRNKDLIDHPVSIIQGGVYENGQSYDHDYVIIGDPNDSDYGLDNTVVVDPWGILAIPTTLRESIFQNPNIKATKPKGVIKPFNTKELENLKRESTRNVEDELKNDFGIELTVGKDHLKSLVIGDDTDRLWNIFTSAQDPSTQYYDYDASSARSFDSVSKAFFDYKLKGFKSSEKLGYGESFNNKEWEKVGSDFFLSPRAESVSLSRVTPESTKL